MNRNTYYFIGVLSVFVFMTTQIDTPFQIFWFVLDFPFANIVVAVIYTLIFCSGITGLHNNAVSEDTPSQFYHEERVGADSHELYFRLKDIRENIKNVNTDDELDQMEKEIDQMESVIRNYVNK